jgi:hypothetical protein
MHGKLRLGGVTFQPIAALRTLTVATTRLRRSFFGPWTVRRPVCRANEKRSYRKQSIGVGRLQYTNLEIRRAASHHFPVATAPARFDKQRKGCSKVITCRSEAILR